MKKLSIILFITLFSITSYARENLGIYAGVGTGFVLGDVKNKSNLDRHYGVPDLAGLKNSINIFAGYNILPYLAVEAEYNYGLNQSVNKTDEDESLKSKFSSQSFFANIVGKYTILEKHIPFVKFGIGYSNYKNKYTDSYIDSREEVEFEDKYTYTSKGLSYEFAITKNHSLVAEYNYVMTPKVNTTEKEDGYDDYKYNNSAKVSYSTINVAYKFTF